MKRTTYDEMMQRVFNTKNTPNSTYCNSPQEKLNWVNTESALIENYGSSYHDGRTNKSIYKSNGSAGCGVVDVPCLSQPWSFDRSPYDQAFFKDFTCDK
jgi:hypothetical protein